MISTILFFFDPISRASLSICLLQSVPQSNLYFDLPSSITLWYLENIMELHNFLWVLHQLLSLTVSNFPGIWVVVNREHRIVN